MAVDCIDMLSCLWTQQQFSVKTCMFVVVFVFLVILQMLYPFWKQMKILWQMSVFVIQSARCNACGIWYAIKSIWMHTIWDEISERMFTFRIPKVLCWLKSVSGTLVWAITFVSYIDCLCIYKSYFARRIKKEIYVEWEFCRIRKTSVNFRRHARKQEQLNFQNEKKINHKSVSLFTFAMTMLLYLHMENIFETHRKT